MTIHCFDDRQLLITGAADGNGHATATRLINQGGRVAMLDISADNLNAAADMERATVFVDRAALA